MTTIHYIVKNTHKPMHPLLIPGQDNSYLPQTKYDPFEDYSDIPRISVKPNEEIISLLPPIDTMRLNEASLAKSGSKKKRKLSYNNTLYTMPSKRKQRLWPSCNYCRVKKTRCDAEVTILYQDKSIIKTINDKLFYILNEQEQECMIKMISDTVGISEQVMNRIEESTSCIIKQIDKIILLEPCSCCCKIRNRVERDTNAEFTGDCTFSSGLTRKDITIFANVLQHCSEKTCITDLTIFDYQQAEYIA
ncbi:similar to Saccharomyces cerevisiae YGL162W SUT1 Transcription factor of the Zn[II]2Cys6 family involved in sterol uptake [Maudiozyma barnettii]|uniref:Similar to Saccharomyces cerevisiae YGL162W SUT1 Transcription factor of the Zn[II]2Cys6 family involved in sterol uptake n=1 Tax=Maudiozyma barnettii TaxID=61262 RepID=A0A8H2VFS7_9SACH|nr:similar to Saccharomyces cerevisiae YGL162W SUT1 Transcription factor of the Zn[II]2Cys6 family involved in sterol uptake [Kazachstania barnettii]CAB4254369.1 similar to Saccharomyces cerevisiae YGL162W SUT1 Transcription factor of the Zn[II]2Cys6 family involved in sterol uptake [Kazachstania barnettii]CAD1782249.1 similar to Saccharomyces cerevisiae YGL162W SUT1 Transcription factor of the Zn[II]2Cys6 family involved in sterol uptake [Kazachstania barnettii]